MQSSQQNSGETKATTIQFADTDDLLDIRYDGKPGLSFSSI